jgi:hypothetical protein
MVHEIETTDDITDWHKLLDCDTLDVARVEREVDIWVDDNGLLRQPYYPIFYYIGYQNPLCGYGLALSSSGPETISLERPPGFFQMKIHFEEWEKRLNPNDYFEQMSRVYPVRHIGKFGIGSHEVHLCSICKKPFQGFGNNPQPVIDDFDARCCDECNKGIVIPARQIRMAKGLGPY